MGYKDPEKQKEYQRQHFKKNRQLFYARVKKRRQENKERVAQILMNSQCVDCGNKDYRVLDFDHVRGEKFLGISRMRVQAFNWEKIQAELEKCEVRCANCHRIVTHERRLAKQGK